MPFFERRDPTSQSFSFRYPTLTEDTPATGGIHHKLQQTKMTETTGDLASEADYRCSIEKIGETEALCGLSTVSRPPGIWRRLSPLPNRWGR